MADCAPAARDDFLSTLSTVQAETRTAVSAKYASDKDSMWSFWKAFIAPLKGVDPYLNSIEPHLHVSFLQVFAHKVRHRRDQASGKPIRAQRVQDYLRTVAQEMRMGSRWRTDPRYGDHLTQHLELILQRRSYSKSDPPPEKVKPLPVPLIRHACANQPNTPQGRATSSALINGYFYLLRPGEYVKSSSAPADAHPFRLQDTTFHAPTGPVNGATGSVARLKQATQITMNFPDQKNQDKDQPITHGDTADPVLSPLKAVLSQVLHLRKHKAPPTTPLYTYYVQNKPHQVTARDLTNTLRRSCSIMGAPLGLQPTDISVRALRNGGCVALIRAGVDPLEARLMGRWRSWAMVEYLQAQSLDSTGYAQRMLDAGTYVIPRHQFLPKDVHSKAQPYVIEA